MTQKKKKDLLIILAIYVFAYLVGFGSCFWIKDQIGKMLAFDLVATFITFMFSVILANSSVYDAYWSLTPLVMSIWIFIEARAFTPWHFIFLIVFNVWSIRLTLNWVKVFTDFSYEDWRYRKFREENDEVMWLIINFFGIHMVPTIVVFAGMLPLFAIAHKEIGIWSIPGMLMILAGALLQFFADRQMHEFLTNTKEKTTCRTGLWEYSRHPNYLGEITVWTGVFLAMIPYAIGRWYYGIGVILVVVLFNVVSIPMMEKRQLARRSDYAEYQKHVSRLLILPQR